MNPFFTGVASTHAQQVAKPTPSLPAGGPFAALAYGLRPSQLKTGEPLPGWPLTVDRGTARLYYRRNPAPLH